MFVSSRWRVYSVLAAACTFEGAIVRTDLFPLRVSSSLSPSPPDKLRAKTLTSFSSPARAHQISRPQADSTGAPPLVFPSGCLPVYHRTWLALPTLQPSILSTPQQQHPLRAPLPSEHPCLLVSTRSPQRPPGSPQLSVNEHHVLSSGCGFESQGATRRRHNPSRCRRDIKAKCLGSDDSDGITFGTHV